MAQVPSTPTSAHTSAKRRSQRVLVQVGIRLRGKDAQGKDFEEFTHVAYLGPVRGGKAEIGLEFTTPCPIFWRVAFPPEDWTSKSPEARTVSNQRTVK